LAQINLLHKKLALS
jgi:hypothetical protein